MLVKVNEKQIGLEGLKGWVEIEMPDPVERLELGMRIAEAHFEMDKKSEDMKMISDGKETAKVAYERIKSLHLTYQDQEFKTVEDIQMYSIFTNILYRIGSIVVNGIPMGKN